MLHRLDHHDRIVDDDANSQDEAEHARHVDREAEEGKQCEGPDDRDGHRQQRDQRRAPVLKKDEDDEHDERDGFEQGDDDVGDRRLHETRGVETDAVVEARREPRPGAVEKPPDAVGRLNGIGAGREVHEDHAGRLVVESRKGLVVLGPQLHACEIANPEKRSVGLRAQDDVAKLLRVNEPAGGVHRILKIGPGRDRGLADGTRWVLTILRLDGCREVGRGQAQRRHLRGIDPYAHPVVLAGREARLADAGKAGNPVEQIDGDEVVEKH